MNSKHESLYFGKAGELFVMSEFLLNGFNVAVPEVDIGDDIFVIYGVNTIYPVQVKSANVVGNVAAFSAQFSLSRTQLLQVRSPELYYAFAIRHEASWLGLFLLNRELLASWYQEGSNRLATTSQHLTISFVQSSQEDRITCFGNDVMPYNRNFSIFLA